MNLEVPQDAQLPGELAPGDASFDISDAADVRALLAAEDAHFWHRARNHFIRDRMRDVGLAQGASVLELGCGAGCVSAELARAGYDVTGVDGHRSLLAVACTRAPKARFFCHDLRNEMPSLAPASFDAVALFDVIEHLEDPALLLARAVRWAKPGGTVVGTVPALMSLWSSIDRHAGHKVRYSQTTLTETLARVPGAKITAITPFFRSLVPLLWVQRRMVGKRDPDDQRTDAAASIENLSVPPLPVNAGLFALTRLEHALAPRLRALPGASLWFALTRT